MRSHRRSSEEILGRSVRRAFRSSLRRGHDFGPLRSVQLRPPTPAPSTAPARLQLQPQPELQLQGERRNE